MHIHRRQCVHARTHTHTHTSQPPPPPRPEQAQPGHVRQQPELNGLPCPDCCVQVQKLRPITHTAESRDAAVLACAPACRGPTPVPHTGLGAHRPAAQSTECKAVLRAHTQRARRLARTVTGKSRTHTHAGVHRPAGAPIATHRLNMYAKAPPAARSRAPMDARTRPMGFHAQAAEHRPTYFGTTRTRTPRSGVQQTTASRKNARTRLAGRRKRGAHWFPHPCPTAPGAHRLAAPRHTAHSGLARPHPTDEQACAHGHRQITDPHTCRDAPAGWGTNNNPKVQHAHDAASRTSQTHACPDSRPWGVGGRQGHVHAEVQHITPPRAPPPPRIHRPVQYRSSIGQSVQRASTPAPRIAEQGSLLKAEEVRPDRLGLHGRPVRGIARGAGHTARRGGRRHNRHSAPLARAPGAAGPGPCAGGRPAFPITALTKHGWWGVVTNGSASSRRRRRSRPRRKPPRARRARRS